MNATATVVLTAVGLFAVYRVARQIASRAVTGWTLVALLFATSLWPTVLAGTRTGLIAAASFALAATALWVGSSTRGALPRGGAALLWLCALALPRAAAAALPHPTLSALGEALFASPAGLFFWSPILWLGVLGLAILATETRALGSWAGGAIALAAVTAAGPAAGPMADGRFHAALPVFAVGIARALSWTRDLVERRPAVLAVAIAGALTIWNFLFMEQYRTDRIPRDLPVSFAAVSETSAAIFTRALGSPNAWPANWVFGWRHRVPPAKYDRVVGQRAWEPGFVAIDDARVDPAGLAEGWGVRTGCGGAPCRRIAGGARLLLSLAPGSPRPTAVRVSGSGIVSVEVNDGSPTLCALAGGTADSPFQGAWHEGVNEITLRSGQPEGAAVLGLWFGPTREK